MRGTSDEELSGRIGDSEMVRRIFEEMPVMVLAVTGPDLRVSAANRGLRALVGRSRVIGIPLREAFAEVAGQQTLEMYERVYATGETITQRGFRVQLEPEGRDDRIEVFLDFTLTPTHDEDGVVTGVLALITDVTDGVRERDAARRRAERAERRYAEARVLIHALQRELLPAGVPVLPGLDLAAGCLLAAADTAAGGDWFDAVRLPDGRMALVVGDVVGHGAAASAVMGQLRVLLHQSLLETGDIAAALAATDRMAGRIPGARATTVCVAVLDPGTGALDYCTAGHPPPLLLPPGEPPRYLAATGAGPLGVGGDFPVGTDRVGPDAVLLLYTDGILERPGRDLAGASVELAQTAADIAADRALRAADSVAAERVAVQTLELLTRVTGYTDDITLLAAQRTSPPPAFEARVHAVPSALAGLRHQLGRWLTAARVPSRDAGAVQHAIGELVTNGLEHAYRDRLGPAVVTVTAGITPAGEFTARIVDEGRWREPRQSPGRGLGLLMAGDLVDTLSLEHDDRGTTAVVTLRLTRPAELLTDQTLASRPTPVRQEPAEPFLILDQPSATRPRIRVDGPVEMATTAAFRSGIRAASGAGTRSLTVDLTGVTLLASTGVAALHRLTALSRANGTELLLYASPGSPADIIMTLVRLPHATTDPDAVEG